MKQRGDDYGSTLSLLNVQNGHLRLPLTCVLKGLINSAPMAQLDEHRVVTREVVSSTPPTLRIFK